MPSFNDIGYEKLSINSRVREGMDAWRINIIFSYTHTHTHTPSNWLIVEKKIFIKDNNW